MKKRLPHHKIGIEETISERVTDSGIFGAGNVLVQRLSSKPLFLLIAVITIIFSLFCYRIVHLVIDETTDFEKVMYRNRLSGTIVFAPRGVIMDRNGLALAASVRNDETGWYDRDVADIPGIGTLIGFIRFPERDKSGYFWRFTTEGASGLEKLGDTVLREQPGYRYSSSDRGRDRAVVAEERVLYPKQGGVVHTTLDMELTRQMGLSLQKFITDNKFAGGAGAVMNIQTGELLGMISLPDIDPDALSRGDAGVAGAYLTDPRHPMLNRVIFGGFSPGSTVKPYMNLAFLNEGVITPDTRILSTGSINVVNPYTKGVAYKFRDWRPEGHGWTNARWALADSVNSFYYTFAGGYGGHKGLGIKKIKEYMVKFGLGEPVPFVLSGHQPGQVPDPAWKWKTFGEAWRLGDTYSSAIGQYGFIVTPLQQLRAIGALASSGYMIQPIILKGQPLSVDRVSGIDERWYDEVRAGMRDVVTSGTAQGLNLREVHIAAKSGTAQVKNKTKITSWVVGFWPYERPQYAFVMMAEEGPKDGSPNVYHAWKEVMYWIVREQKTEYLPDAEVQELMQANVSETARRVPALVAPDPESDDSTGDILVEPSDAQPVEFTDIIPVVGDIAQ